VIRTRVARVDDLGVVLAMAERFVGASQYHVWAVDPERVAALFDVCRQTGAVLLAVDVDREEVAAGMLAFFVADHPLTGERYAEELAFWVEPEHRGGTAARRLIARASEYARQRHASCLKMSQPESSPAVGALYQRAGFVAVEHTWVQRF